MPEIEAPEVEIDEDAPAFRRRLALVVVLITLFGACVAYLHEQNSNLEDNAAREAQLQSIKAFGKQVRSSTEGQTDYSVFVQQQLLLRQQDIAQGRKLTDAGTGASVADQDITRLGQVSDAVGALTPITSSDQVFPTYASLDLEPDKARMTQEVFANKANDYGNKADSYVAVLTVLAVALFLIGLSLTVTGRGRYLLAVPGVAIAAICVVWAVVITTGSITQISPKAIDLAAQGQQKQSSGDVKGAIDDYKAAIADSPQFGQAFARLSGAEFDAGATTQQGQDLVSVSSKDATKRAIDAGEKAVSLGQSSANLLSSLGFFHFTLGEYGRAEDLAQQAVQTNDQVAPFVFNLGVAQVGQGEKSAARKTYDKGIDEVNQLQDTNERLSIIEAARTDLEIAETNTPDTKELVKELKGKLTAVEAPLLEQRTPLPQGTEVPDRAPDNAKATNIAVKDERFRMQAEFDVENVDDTTPVTAVWYYRAAGSGEDAFSQISALDSITVPSNGHVVTTPLQFGSCLPNGEYRVDVYVGPDLIGHMDPAATYHDGPLGPASLETDTTAGAEFCLPTAWESVQTDVPGAVTYDDPKTPQESIAVITYALGSDVGNQPGTANALLTGLADDEGLTNRSALTTGNELLGVDRNNFFVDLNTVSMTATSTTGEAVDIIVSVGSDGVARAVVVTAGDPQRLDQVRATLVNSVRFLRVPDN